ncbi:MAG: hypothetical protein LBB82_05990, partial [Treponema sp.]|nr:hypothetical protein [Treponema sp.]
KPEKLQEPVSKPCALAHSQLVLEQALLSGKAKNPRGQKMFQDSLIMAFIVPFEFHPVNKIMQII